MNTNEFNALTAAQIERTSKLLEEREAKAVTGDQLHTLKQAADLQGITLREAMAGYMADHTILLYEMMRDPAVWSMDVWEEKITKQMVDLILLNAVIKEEDLERKGLNGVPEKLDAPAPEPPVAGDFVPTPVGDPELLSTH